MIFQNINYNFGNYFNQKNVDSTNQTQTIISYCSGIRGLETGLERSGLPIKTVAFLEIEAFIVANLVAQMEVGLLDPGPIWTNIKTFDARPFRNKIHGIVGGYPCQPFSHAGERKGIEDERHLFPHILEQVKIIRPEWVFFENVAGHLTLGYDEVRRNLSDIGYRVEEGIFTAEEVGAPHRRERLFILGIMEDAGILGWGRRNLGDKGRKQCEVQVTGSGASLEYAGHIRSTEYEIETAGIEQQCQTLDDPNSNDTGTGFGNIRSEKRESIGEAYERERMRREHGPLNSEMDYPLDEGLQRYSGNDSGAKGRQGQERSATPTSLFPAGQGEYQHEWEEPRTIKSSLVYTIDGYNFTEDLHRAIGNAVVEQTAQLAFLTLLQKHIKNAS